MTHFLKWFLGGGETIFAPFAFNRRAACSVSRPAFWLTDNRVRTSSTECVCQSSAASSFTASFFFSAADTDETCCDSVTWIDSVLP